jgi:putative Mn2+ efflux pump MntP
MPRWLGAIIMIGVGLNLLYQGIANPRVRLPGSKLPLRACQGRIFYAVLAVMVIGGGLAVWFGFPSSGSP